MDELMKFIRGKSKRITPEQLRLDMIEEFGVTFHITYVRKLMQRCNMSAKRTTSVPVSRATKRHVSWLQKCKKGEISRLKRQKYVIAAQDEAHFVGDKT